MFWPRAEGDAPTGQVAAAGPLGGGTPAAATGPATVSRGDGVVGKETYTKASFRLSSGHCSINSLEMLHAAYVQSRGGNACARVLIT